MRAWSIALPAAIAALFGAPESPNAQDLTEPSPAMISAGAAAALRLLPQGTWSAGGATAEAVAAAVFAAMAEAQWQPIATAPQDGRDMLLALRRDGAFLRGVGRWQVTDEAHMPGFWTVTEWFGEPPSHWAPLPPPPSARP